MAARDFWDMLQPSWADRMGATAWNPPNLPLFEGGPPPTGAAAAPGADPIRFDGEPMPPGWPRYIPGPAAPQPSAETKRLALMLQALRLQTPTYESIAAKGGAEPPAIPTSSDSFGLSAVPSLSLAQLPATPPVLANDSSDLRPDSSGNPVGKVIPRGLLGDLFPQPGDQSASSEVATGNNWWPEKPSAIENVVHPLYPHPSSPPPPSEIPGGPWKWAPDINDDRGGKWKDPYGNSGGWDEWDGHWDMDDVRGIRQRYNRHGAPITDDEAHGKYQGPPRMPFPRWPGLPYPIILPDPCKIDPVGFHSMCPNSNSL